MDIKFTCQQYVRREKGFALTDMFLPQFNLHIEVDEPHHIKNFIKDKNRELDIIETTNHSFERVAITGNIEELHGRIEELVNIIKEKKSSENFIPWQVLEDYDLDYYKKKKSIHVDDNSSFKLIFHVCNLFGNSYKGFQKALAKNQFNLNQDLWFPKFYENKEWDNRISENGEYIYEICKNPIKKHDHFTHSATMNRERITFPRMKDNLGFVFYRFKGIFLFDEKLSSIENGVVYKRVAKEVHF